MLIDNAVAPTRAIDVQVSGVAANIRSLPSSSGTVLLSAQPGTTLEAVGRLENNSWIRVRVPNSDSIGWVFVDLVTPINATETFNMLATLDGAAPHYGAMQAFYYESGSSSDCGNIAADGLIIQTPSGNARVNLLINEVSIEFIGGQNGATAFMTANYDDGMIVNMVEGTGAVSVSGAMYFVNAANSTTIELNEDLLPISEPSNP